MASKIAGRVRARCVFWGSTFTCWESGVNFVPNFVPNFDVNSDVNFEMKTPVNTW